MSLSKQVWMVAATLAFGTVAVYADDVEVKNITSTSFLVEVSANNTAGVQSFGVRAQALHEQPVLYVEGGGPWEQAFNPNGAFVSHNVIPNERYLGVSANLCTSSSCGPYFPTQPVIINTSPADIGHRTGTRYAVGSTSLTLYFKDFGNPSWTPYQIIYRIGTSGDLTSNPTQKNNDATVELQEIRITGLPRGVLLKNVRLRAKNFSYDKPSIGNFQTDSNELSFGDIQLEDRGISVTDITLDSVASDGLSGTLRATYSLSQVPANTPLSFTWRAIGNGTTFSPNPTSGPTTTGAFDRSGAVRIEVTAVAPNDPTIESSTFSKDVLVPSLLKGSLEITGNPVPPYGVGQTITFTAKGKDQFNQDVLNVVSNWQLTGTGDAQLTTTNPTASAQVQTGTQNLRTYTIRATSGTITGTKDFSTIGNPPTVTISNFQLYLSSASLSAQGNDIDAGQTATLRYFWDTVQKPAGASDPTFSKSGTTDAANTTVRFHAPSSNTEPYVLRVTARDTDDLSGTAVTQAIVVLSQAQSIRVCEKPYSDQCAQRVTLKLSRTTEFAAKIVDQFGGSVQNLNPTWDVTGGGTINPASGQFTATILGEDFKVNARANGIVGTLSLAISNLDVSEAKAFPVPWKSTGSTPDIQFACIGTRSTIRIFTSTGRPVKTINHNNAASCNGLTCTGCESWNLKNDDGERVASGVYFYIVESSENKREGKLVIIQ